MSAGKAKDVYEYNTYSSSADSDHNSYEDCSILSNQIPDAIAVTLHEVDVSPLSCGPWIRAADHCKEAIQQRIASSKLFSRNDGDPEDEKDFMAVFQFNEIELGQFLGRGEFSNVFEIKSFRPQPSKKENHSEDLLKQQEHARNFLTQHVKREKTGQSRYAIKFLREDLLDNPEKFVVAAHDLALEAQFLSSLEHPNIIKIRGWAADGTDGFITGRNKGYFLILDCLEETLETRIGKWAKEDKRFKARPFRIFRSKSCSAISRGPTGREILFGERLKVTYDIAGAMLYLHKQNVIYRDLKPANLGFDVRGDIKLFDFGLAKELPPDIDMNEDTYEMSGAGSLRYMAPEVVLRRPYNLKADVFSLSVLIYEILAMKKPYARFSVDKLINDVIIGGGRPKLQARWPEAIRDILEMSWSDDASERPTMELLQNVVRFHAMEMRNGDDTGLERVRRRRSYGSIGTVSSNYQSGSDHSFSIDRSEKTIES